MLNAWRAARFCLPGIVAHESARRDGESMAVPDLGDAPSSLTIMDLEQESGKPLPAHIVTAEAEVEAASAV